PAFCPAMIPASQLRRVGWHGPQLVVILPSLRLAPRFSERGERRGQCRSPRPRSGSRGEQRLGVLDEALQLCREVDADRGGFWIGAAPCGAASPNPHVGYGFG